MSKEQKSKKCFIIHNFLKIRVIMTSLIWLDRQIYKLSCGI